MKKILITGCSSGFGYNATKYLAVLPVILGFAFIALYIIVKNRKEEV